MTSAEGSSATRQGGWAIPLVVLIVGMFMSVLDTSIVNVAIPAMQRSLGTSAEDVLWVVTGYTLALGVAVPLSGWLGERFGLTRVYLASLLGFTAASALCGMAWDLNSMVIFRIMQAIPGGVLPVVTMTMLYRIVPPERIGAAMGMYGLGVVFAPALGPTLGGYLVEYVDWRLIFYINVPVGLLGAIAAFIVFPRIQPTSWPRFDLWGFLAIAYGLSALLLATDKGQDWGWTSYPILILLASSVLSLALFVIIELEVANPLLDVRVFRVWPFTNSILLISVLSVGLFTALYYVPLFLQTNQGLQPLDAGLVLMPSALVMTVMMPVAGRLYDRFGPRWPAVVGLTITAVGSWLLAGITPDVPRSDIIVWTIIRNLGVGLAMMPIMTAGVSALPRNLVASGSALNNVGQRVSASIGLAVFGGMVTAQQAQLFNDRSGFYTAAPSAPAEIGAAAQEGTSGLFPLYQQLMQHVITTSYANAFYVVSLLCVVAIALALLLRSGPVKTPPQSAPASEGPTGENQSTEKVTPDPENTADSAPARSENTEQTPNRVSETTDGARS